MMSDWEMIGLAGSAVGAGVINAVAGGGTLLTFPTLLAFGVSPVRPMPPARWPWSSAPAAACLVTGNTYKPSALAVAVFAGEPSVVA